MGIEISAQAVKELREKTSAGMMDCKKALQDSNGDMSKAMETLRQKGLASATKKTSRIATEGVVESYIHMGGKLGVMVEVNCETDFVARRPEFQELAKNIAMQIAASPLVEYISLQSIPADVVEKEKETEVPIISNSSGSVCDVETIMSVSTPVKQSPPLNEILRKSFLINVHFLTIPVKSVKLNSLIIILYYIFKSKPRILKSSIIFKYN